MIYICTVIDHEDLIFCEKIGTDAVITDYPTQAREVLGYS